MPLNDTKIRNSKPSNAAYKLTDGGGMYLLLRPSGARYWRLDYRFAGMRRTLALGVYPTITLSEARARRDEARKLLANNIDPGIQKRAQRRAMKYSNETTFEAVAREWLAGQRKRLALRYQALLQSRLDADVFPIIGRRPIAEIDAVELLEVLRKVEARGAVETARRLRQLCGQVFRFAVATGRASRDLSADLRGAISSPGRKRGHRAMPIVELPGFLAAVDGYDGEPRTRLALRLVVLTFVRTSELRGAQWSEFEGLDRDKPVWRLPSARTKMKTEHIVPLSTQAVSLLGELRALPGSSSSPFLFPSGSREGCMSNNTMLFALYRLGYHGRATVHGFRTMASTALNEMGFRKDVIERQLAHEERDQVRAAYNHAEYLTERRDMMQHWADHIDGLVAPKVIALRSRG